MVNVAYIAASLDGYIATEAGGLEWLEAIPNPDSSDFGYADFIERVDAIVMGRNTFEKVLSFSEWPYQKPIFVLSNYLSKVPEHLRPKVQLVNGDLVLLCQKLSALGYRNLYVDGGGTIQSFLQQDLIDELIITRVPILLGGGYSLFGKLEQPLDFVHAKTEIYHNHLVKSHYVRKRSLKVD